MKKNNAEQDIQFIREVLNKTQHDISKIGMCFIWIGIVNLLGEVFKNIGYAFINAQEEISKFQWKMLRSIDSISSIIICIIFFTYFIKLLHEGNDISKSILKIWGVLLIGGKLFTKIFVKVAVQKQIGVTAAFAATMEKAFYFLCIIIALTVLGILIHDKLICGGALFGSIIYCLLLNWGRTFTIARIHGNPVNMYPYDIFSVLILSFGMILLGMYARIRGREKCGNS